MGSLLGTINAKTEAGFENPLVGQYSINDMEIKIYENVLTFDLVFKADWSILLNWLIKKKFS